MNRKIVLSMLLLISVVAIILSFLMSKKKISIENLNTLQVHETIGSKITDDVKAKQQQQVLAIQKMTDEIDKFNKEIARDLSNKNSKRDAITRLMAKQRENPSDVVDEINRYYNNIPANQIEIADLLVSCVGVNKNLASVEKQITQSNSQITDRLFNIYYFYQGMIESDMCKSASTIDDPFFKMLKAARGGHILSQFLLNQNLDIAIQRKLINIKKYPLDYMNLRSESVGYLQQLSAKGVAQASARLAHLYSWNSHALPQDLVLQYYYSYLANTQRNGEGVILDTDSIYIDLTDKQKIIVDRMTENL